MQSPPCHVQWSMCWPQTLGEYDGIGANVIDLESSVAHRDKMITVLDLKKMSIGTSYHLVAQH